MEDKKRVSVAEKNYYERENDEAAEIMNWLFFRVRLKSLRYFAFCVLDFFLRLFPKTAGGRDIKFPGL